MATRKEIKEGKAKEKVKKSKVFSYLPIEDIVRLRAICKKYGFKSIYQVVQYLVHCFLRVADPENDKYDEPIPEEIESMFVPLGEYEVHHAQRKQQRSQQTPDDLFNKEQHKCINHE